MGIGEIRFKDSFQNTKVDGNSNAVTINQNTIYYSLPRDQSLERRLILLEESQCQQEDSFNNLVSRVSDFVESMESQFDEIKIIQKFQRFKDSILEIEMESKASIKAAEWMNRNLNELVIYSSKLVFNKYLQLNNCPKRSVSMEEYKSFQKDLFTLYTWILDPMIAGGFPPRNLKKEELALPISYTFYSAIFETIRVERFDTLSIKNLPPASIEILKIYFDRFLIERGNQEI